MNQNSETLNMLNDIYQAASMGAQGCDLMLKKTEDTKFAKKLRSYSVKYNEIKNEAASILTKNGSVPKDAGTMEKSRLWMGVELNTLIDKTPSHMAEMLIQGSTMGIIASEKHKNTHPQADPQCSSLENRFLTVQQEHIDDMKKFLC